MHRRKLKRHHVAGAARFLTFGCYRWLPLFKNEKICDLFVQRLIGVTQTLNLEVLAWVIMPDHVHLIVYDDSDSVTMTRFTHALKRPFALEVLNRLRKLNAPILAKLKHGEGYRFWQTGGGFDRVLEDELIEKIRYIHANPVRKSLAKTAAEYRWSSAASYEGLEHVGPKIAFDRLPVAKIDVI